jgi:hypothetical protein
VLNFKLLITFSIPKNEQDRNYEKVVVQSSINACKMFNGVTGDFISKMIMEKVKDFVDFDVKCPIKKGQWKIKNFIFGDSNLPTYLLQSDLKYMLLAKATIKTPSSKGMVDFFTTRISGEVKKK